MATVYWEPDASVTAVAQVTTVTVGGTLSGETFTLTVGDVTVASHTDADTVIATTVAALVSAWNANAHIYPSQITAVDASPDITLTADTAGVPFVVTLNTPGGAATLGQAATTASGSSNDWSVATNWSGGAVPVNSDDVVIDKSSVSILWGLAQSAVTLDSLTVTKRFTGKLGLNSREFQTSSTATSTDVEEYRQVYLNIKSTVTSLGEHFGTGTPAGSTRIMLDLDSTASTVTVFDTALTAAETGLPAVRLLAASASTNIFVRSSQGGVGVAVDAPGETSTIGKMFVVSTSANTVVRLGEGTTLTTWEQYGGNNTIEAAATITTITSWNGNLRTEGDYVVTTGNCRGGTWTANHIKTAGNAFTTLNVDGGNMAARGSGAARTWATVNFKAGQIKADSSVVTITTLNEADSGPYTADITRS